MNEIHHRFQKNYEEITAQHFENCQCGVFQITRESVLDCIYCLKLGKSFDDEQLSAEHLIYAPVSLVERLHQLMNSMLRHAYVPNQFKRGTIVPLVKDHQGDHGSMDNYRGITLSPIISKAFEHAMRTVFGPYLVTSHFQFGYKKKSSTIHALYTLKETINHYTDRGSNVFCAFLDASKAFDRLVHAGLFLKLLDRGAPMILIDIVKYWYSELFCRVRWDCIYSDWFPVIAGVRQGGILSPDFYCIYVDDMITGLKDLNIGCKIRDILVSALGYADDMALISPSLRGLQRLLRHCERYCKAWDICLNPKKSRCMYFGKRRKVLCKLLLNGNCIEWAEKWTYLGIDLVSHKSFNCCIDSKLRKFYRCLNSILRVGGRSNDLIMLRLLEAHCIPILTYGVEIVFVADRNKRRQLRVAYNSVFRRIFDYRQYQSVRELQSFFHRPTWEELCDRRQSKFMNAIRSTNHLNCFLDR